MIREILIVLLVMLTNAVMGQYQLLVLDQLTQKPVSDVHLVNYTAKGEKETLELIAISNDKGEIDFSAASIESSNNLFLTHVSYESVQLNLQSIGEKDQHAIYLEEKIIDLAPFVVGSKENNIDDFELIPERSVDLNGSQLVKAFYIQKHEVTVGQFRQFVLESGYITDVEKGNLQVQVLQLEKAVPKYQKRFEQINEESFQKASRSRFAGWERRFVLVQTDTVNWRHDEFGRLRDNDDYPVIHVSYRDAQAYAAWYGLELPSKLEWLAITEDGKQKDWIRSNSTGIIRKVGLSPPDKNNLTGIFGNVSEYLEITTIGGVESIIASPLNTFSSEYTGNHVFIIEPYADSLKDFFKFGFRCIKRD